MSNRVGWSFMGDGSRVWDFTRASDGARVNSAGTLETIVANGLRYDHDMTTGVLIGALVEPARANSIRNNTMAGAMVGTPGTLPTNWAVAAAGGLTTTVVALGTEKGINYIDLQISGTTSSTFYVFKYDDGIACSVGQVWAQATYHKLVSGSLTNITSTSVSLGVTGGSSNLATAFTPTSTLTRYSNIGTLAGSPTSLDPRFSMAFSSGVAVNITIRIGLPQLEQIVSGVSVATTPIRTTGSAATRAVDALSLPIPPGTYSVGVVGGTVLQAGTTYTDTVTVTGTAWDFAWPTAAVTAGERHLQRVFMRRTG